MFLSRMLLLGLVLCCVSQPVSATPPDIIDVRDELFGISRSSLFLLRSTHDNLGRHDSDQRDVQLVALDRATGKESLWPVYRARRVPDMTRDPTGVARKTEVSSLPNAVDAFAKLRELGGFPIGASDGFDDGRNGVTIEGGILSITQAGSAVARAEMATILGGVTASLDNLAESVGDYERLAPIGTRDLLGGQSFQAEWCKGSNPFVYDDLSGALPVRIARLTCQDPEGQAASLLVLVRPQSQPR